MITRVVDRRDLTPTTFVLRVERGDLDFEPGQYVTLGRPGSLSSREYTVYSSPREPFVEVLVKVVPGGLVSAALHRLDPGDLLEMEGPFGKFRIPPDSRRGRPHLFVATGTGISPFHCFVTSYPDLEYRLAHGVRGAADLYERETFDRARYVACLSREPGGGDYTGRVSAWLKGEPVLPGTRCYLCGGSDMIYEVMAILRDRGVPREDMFAETYF